MKNFFTSMLGALVALLIFSLGACVMFFGFLGLIAALKNSDKAPAVASGAYVVLDLSVNITDAPPRFSFEMFEDNPLKTMQLRTMTRALRAAAQDDRIAGVFIKGSIQPTDFGSGYAALKEVRAALATVRAAGKPVKAYLTYATTRDYYLASMASDLVMDPYGQIIMPGLASEPIFFAGAFEKYGIGVQVTRVGKYKSAIEPYTRKDMSPENREQLQKLLDDIWGQLIGDIAHSREITPEKIQALVDSEGLIRPEVAKAAKLVDRVAYRDEVIDDLKKLTHRTGAKEAFNQITLEEYARVAHDPGMPLKKTAPGVAAPTGHGTIAVVYAEGEIVDGEGEPGYIGSAKFARELRSLRQDSEVKAIVLRVNSPGGSASASEEIQREIRLIRQAKKPVIVSMGTYAASGGYWISAYGDRIFAEPTTVTGSIGVFGIQFDIQKLANNFGVTFDSVKTGKFADALTISRPKTPEELAVFQREVDWIYSQFIDKVSDARHLKREVVEDIAQGRVWSGFEARKLGLVDEMGGLNAALAYAAQTAELGPNYKLTEYPRKKDLGEVIQEFMDNLRPMSGVRSGGGIANRVLQKVATDLKTLESFNDPLGLYARLPVGLEIH
jgi:protease IV